MCVREDRHTHIKSGHNNDRSQARSASQDAVACRSPSLPPPSQPPPPPPSGALDVFLDFISYSTGPLPEAQLARLSLTDCPVRILWGEVCFHLSLRKLARGIERGSGSCLGLTHPQACFFPPSLWIRRRGGGGELKQGEVGGESGEGGGGG